MADFTKDCEEVAITVLRAAQKHDNGADGVLTVITGLAVAAGRLAGTAMAVGVSRKVIHDLFETLMPIMVTQADLADKLTKAMLKKDSE
jgi:hypothetical protein